jgi:hypothetical protein
MCCQKTDEKHQIDNSEFIMEKFNLKSTERDESEKRLVLIYMQLDWLN